MPDPDLRPLALRVEKWLLGAAIAGALGLAFQLTHPLDGRTTAPAFVNFTCAGALGLGLLRFLARGKHDERWIAFLSLLGLWAFLGVCEPWSVEGPGEFASKTASFLSMTHMEVALIALGAAWLCLGIGLLCGRAVLLCVGTVGPWERGGAWLVGLLVGAFGAHGVMGYASGNSSLLLP